MVISANMNIIITYSLAVLVAIHSLKFRGVYKTLLLFFGAVIAGGGLKMERLCLEDITIRVILSRSFLAIVPWMW